MLCIQGEGEVLTNFDSHEQLNPAEFQKGLPTDTLIRREGPQFDDTPLDIVFVGAGPAGLAGAIELARLIKQDNM